MRNCHSTFSDLTDGFFLTEIPPRRQIFHPRTRVFFGARIADLFLDTDYKGESFFVRPVCFLRQNEPHTSLKTTLKAEINPEACGTLNSTASRPFVKPKSGRIAIKVMKGDRV